MAWQLHEGSERGCNGASVQRGVEATQAGPAAQPEEMEMVLHQLEGLGIVSAARNSCSRPGGCQGAVSSFIAPIARWCSLRRIRTDCFLCQMAHEPRREPKARLVPLRLSAPAARSRGLHRHRCHCHGATPHDALVLGSRTVLRLGCGRRLICRRNAVGGLSTQLPWYVAAALGVQPPASSERPLCVEHAWRVAASPLPVELRGDELEAGRRAPAGNTYNAHVAREVGRCALGRARRGGCDLRLGDPAQRRERLRATAPGFRERRSGGSDRGRKARDGVPHRWRGAGRRIGSRGVCCGHRARGARLLLTPPLRPLLQSTSCVHPSRWPRALV